MYYEDESGAVKFFAGMVLGAVIGASLALLTAPQSGKRTRRRLLRAVTTARDSAGSRWRELADELPLRGRGARTRQ